MAERSSGLEDSVVTELASTEIHGVEGGRPRVVDFERMAVQWVSPARPDEVGRCGRWAGGQMGGVGGRPTLSVYNTL